LRFEVKNQDPGSRRTTGRRTEGGGKYGIQESEQKKRSHAKNVKLAKKSKRQEHSKTVSGSLGSWICFPTRNTKLETRKRNPEARNNLSLSTLCT
jgi:hypothetical protein